MAVKKVALASRWMSVSDIGERLGRARENRDRQTKLIDGLEGRARQRRDDVERSLADLPSGQRMQVVDRAVGGFRAELKRESADARRSHVREAARLRDEVAGVRAHYDSPVQMLMRKGLGSERRSRLLQQIERSGPTELASLAALAAGTGDRELGAALCSRIYGTAAAERPFSAQALADALVGDAHRAVTQAFMEIDRTAMESLHADGAFERGRANLTGAVQAALMRRDERAVGADPSHFDPETDDQTEE